MQQIGIRGDVDTFTYESWPLLRPDELEVIPSGVLRASAADLAHMCRQGSGSDPIVAYALRQEERTRAILRVRAAQARVQALLAGTEFVGRERLETSSPQGSRAPQANVASSHDPHYLHSTSDSTENYLRSNRDPTLPATAGSISEERSEERGKPERSLRSPPRLRSSRGQDSARVTAVIDTTVLGERSGNAKTSLSRDGSEVDGGKPSPVTQEGHRGVVPAALAHGLRDVHGDQAAFVSGATNNCAVRDSWGSVFIVEGGRRRRRLTMRQRSSEAEETPAARRAQVEKERQERRKASLRRLMARKEQRAKQQEARRKRKAAAAKAAAATVAATADAVKGATAAPAIETTAADGNKKQSSLTTEAASHLLAPVAGGKEESGESDQHRLGVHTSSTPVVCDVSAATVGDREGSGSEESLQDVAATAASTNFVINDRSDGCYSSSSQSESVSGGDSSEERDLSVDASEGEGEKDETASESTVYSTNETVPGEDRGGFEARSIPDVTVYPPSPLGSHKDGGVSSAGVHASNGRIGYSGCGTVLEDESAYLRALTHNQRSAHTVDEKPGGHDSKASGEADGILSLGAEESSNNSIGYISPCHSDHYNHGAESPCDERRFSEDTFTEEHTTTSILRKRGVRPQTRAVAVVEGPSTTTNGTLPVQLTSPEVDVRGLRASTLPNDHEEIMTHTGPPGSDGADSGMEWEEEKHKREDDGASDVGCDEMSKGGPSMDSASEFPGPLDVQPITQFHPAETRVASGSRSIRAGDGQQHFISSAGESKEVHASARFPPDSNDAVIASTADNNGPKALDELPPFTSVLASPPPPMPLDPRETCNPSCRMTNRPAMETGMHGPTNKVVLENQEAQPRGNKASTRTGTEEKYDTTESPDPGLPKRSDITRVQQGKHGPDSISDAKSSITMIDSTSTTCANASHQVFSEAPQGRQRRNGSAMLRLSENSLGASDGTSDGGSRGTRFEAGGGIEERPSKAACGTSRSGGSSVRLLDCYPRFPAILTAYHNGRALTRQADCRSLPLTSKIMSKGKVPGGDGSRVAAGQRGGAESALTAAEEEACLLLQWKLYAIHVRVIKDYAAVFSYGDGWSTNRAAEDPSSLVYSGDSTALHYRVNSKARPEVYNIVTDVLNNR
ncbi:unnamed protein product, partial [Hapterophycus canaliculatus]